VLRVSLERAACSIQEGSLPPCGGVNRAKLDWRGVAGLQAAGCKLLAGR